MQGFFSFVVKISKLPSFECSSWGFEAQEEAQ
jgi:hypothetical protein